MFFSGIGTATPPSRFTKAECLAAFQRSDWYSRLDTRSHLIARTVLQRDNGIEARRLALDSLDEVFVIDPDTLGRRFLVHAPVLAAEAATRALESARLGAAQIGAVVVSTCTGYLCPGLSGYVVERLGLRADVQAYDLVGQGCAAALPNCGYCKRFEADLQKINDVTVHTFLIPILSPDSAEKSKNIWCAKDKTKAWLDWMVREQSPAKASCDTAALERNLAFSRKYKITGTPTIFFADGSRVPGAIGAQQIEKMLTAGKTP